MRIPFAAPREDESDEACAVRAVALHCEIDGDAEVRVLPFVPRGVVYRVVQTNFTQEIAIFYMLLACYSALWSQQCHNKQMSH